MQTRFSGWREHSHHPRVSRLLVVIVGDAGLTLGLAPLVILLAAVATAALLAAPSPAGPNPGADRWRSSRAPPRLADARSTASVDHSSQRRSLMESGDQGTVPRAG